MILTDSSFLLGFSADSTKMCFWVVTFFGIFAALIVRPSSGQVVPDFHWPFDHNILGDTYEVNSVTENVGRILNGSEIVGSEERYGSVAHFRGVDDPGIIIDNITSTCFLDPGSCSTGLSFGFWINWKEWGSAPFFVSKSIALDHFTDIMFLIEMCQNATKCWKIFFTRNPAEYYVWYHYMITWDKSTLRVFVDGVEKGMAGSPVSPATAVKALNTPTSLFLGTKSPDSKQSPIKMYMDDLMIWERPLTANEVKSVHKTGIYDPNLFIMNGFSNAWQFISIPQDAVTQSMEDSTIIAQYSVANLQGCFNRCYQHPRCRTVGYRKNGTCKISNSGLITLSKSTTSEAFYYYSVHKN
eukprot:Seg13.2 transcript_id=Seg13.2/GoldUCD/mRNA.D3Y31 product="hypothetical protein" protein_id=Seg13.2/GoldUCD/D3Y31